MVTEPLQTYVCLLSPPISKSHCARDRKVKLTGHLRSHTIDCSEVPLLIALMLRARLKMGVALCTNLQNVHVTAIT